MNNEETDYTDNTSFDTESTALSPSLPEGTLLQGGKYSITRFIKNGGFGCTYEAEQRDLGRVAIKEFFPTQYCVRSAGGTVTVGTSVRKGLVEKLKSKFKDEAKTIFSMRHANIVHVSDFFEENGTVYYVMDYIDGESLEQIVSRDGALSEREAVGYVSQIADALRYVHSCNYLHLDIKPANIMVDRNGKAILIDFGVSKQYDEVDGENTSTLMGYTPGYAPGEQMTHEVARFLPATDIYALGATLYKLLSGVTPISATARSAGEELLPLPDTISESVRAAVSNAMNLNKHLRTQSAEEFISSLSSSNQQPKPSEDDVNVNPRTITTESSAKWMDIKEFLSSVKRYRNFTIPSLIVLFMGLYLLVAGIYGDDFSVIKDRGLDIVTGISFWFLSLIFMLVSSPILRKVYNIEWINLKKRRVTRVQNAEGKFGLCECGVYKMRKKLAMKYDAIEPLGDEAYICRRGERCGLYNITRSKMVIPVTYQKLEMGRDGNVEACLDGVVTKFTIKGYRAIQ